MGLALATHAASPSIAERLDRAERFQDWAAVQKLSATFVFARRGDLFALTSILDGCIARECDEEAAVASLRGPLVTDGVREFARAWLEYAARDPSAARPRFEALSRDPATAWLGLFGRLSYASDARNVTLLREALRDARADPIASAALAEDIGIAEMSLATLEGDDGRLASLSGAAGNTSGGLMSRFAQQLAADDFKAATATLQRYAGLFGEDQDLVMARLDLLQARRPPDEVAVAAKRALAAHPRYWRVRFVLAQSLMELDDEEGARAVFAEGMPVAFANVRLELAVLRASFDEFAGDDLEIYASGLDPYRDFPEAQSALAAALLKVGRPVEAVQMLDRADTMTDALPSTLQVRARVARETGEMAEYVRLLERVVARVRNDVGLQLALGFAYVKAGEAVQAARVAAGLRRSPRYVNLERIELLEKAAREADPSFTTASAASPGRSPA